MEQIYLAGFEQDGSLHLTTRSAVVVYVMEYCQTDCHKIILVREGKTKAVYPVTLECPSCCSASISSDSDRSHLVESCTLPAVMCSHSNKVISGLCGVLRYILLTSAREGNNTELLQLLGHKQICLKACAEVSLWTRFCEVDMPNAIDSELSKNSFKADSVTIPVELLQLERQFQQPCVVANMNKRIHKAQMLHKKHTESDIEKQPNAMLHTLKHDYVEGPDMTLADLDLLPCIALWLNHWHISLSQVSKWLPQTVIWIKRLLDAEKINIAFSRSNLPKPDADSIYHSKQIIFNLPDCDHMMPVVRESKIKKFKANQVELQNVLQKLSHHELGIHEDQPSYDVSIPWQKLPEAVHPKDGDLPKERLERKCQQLENLATAVVRIAQPGQTVVDFCSGGGHLGIILAYLLPECKVILVENKEQSIGKAEKRIKKLQLNNITIYQCNLDYFTGSFDIGVCLHACGVATDLVLQCCLNNSASFVICPCCYGSIHNTHTVTYPRSKEFKKMGISYKDYLTLGHGADQTQFNIPSADRGKLCMLYIDTDRANLAVEYGYTVTLTTLRPPECSPKNDLLVGTKCAPSSCQ